MRRLLVLASLWLLACQLPLQPSDMPGKVVRPCLQVGFGYQRSVTELQAARSYGFEVARISVEHHGPEEANAIIQNAIDGGFEPLTIVRNASQLRYLPEGGRYELHNEPDLAGTDPAEYRALAWDAAAVARQRNQILYIGSISNLHQNNFEYLRAIKPFPAGVRISVHRYGDGEFDAPKGGFRSRDGEVRWLQAEIDHLPFAVTEFGYPDVDMAPETAAARIRQEFEFWQGKADFACLYQISDGPTRRTLDTYGIFRVDGSPKPQAFVLQRP